jgi:FkbM family methyltransferase
VSDVLTINHGDGSYRIHNPGGRIGSKLVNGEPYERQLLCDVRALGLSGTAFDIGANVGNHTLWFAIACGLRVQAWEPCDTTRKILRSNIALNAPLGVRVHAWAAGAETGRGRLNSSMTIKLDRGKTPVYAIDDKVVVDDLAVVKVDVEGMEHLALAGMVDHLERCKPVVYAECHSDKAHKQVAGVLEPLGYGVDKQIQMGSLMERWRV